MIIRFHEQASATTRYADCLVLVIGEEALAPVYLPRSKVHVAADGSAMEGVYESDGFRLPFSGIFGNRGRPIDTNIPTWVDGKLRTSPTAFEELYWSLVDIELSYPYSDFRDPEFRASADYAEAFIAKHCYSDLSKYSIKGYFFVTRKQILQREHELRSGANNNLFTSGYFRDAARYVVT